MADLRRTIEAVWRIESAKVIARLARMVRDVGIAEDLAQDALVAALETWPQSGVPDNPGAWLMTAARNRAIDTLRRSKVLEQKMDQYGRDQAGGLEVSLPDFDASLDRAIEDDLLSLVFTTCHPMLSGEGRVALTLKVLGGLSTDEIARAYLVTEKTVAQRIVRAKRTLTEARVPIETPRGDELTPRLESVLEVIYLIFNEGYSATSGHHWTRPELCEEAQRLGRILATLMPRVPEVHGLVALMELQASRLRSRTGPDGELVLLLDQDRSLWDQMLIRRGLVALKKAEEASELAHQPLGAYTLQAKIAACHAKARLATETEWTRIASLYDGLAQVQPSPVVELNRAVAVAMAYGPAAGLEIVDGLANDPSLKDYHWLPSVRGDLLFKMGRVAEAATEFRRAASLTLNTRERAELTRRADRL